MRLTRILTLAGAAGGLMVGAALALSGVAHLYLTERARIEAAATDTGRHVSDLIILTGDFLLNREPRAARQWDAVSAQLSESVAMLDALAAPYPALQRQAADLLHRHGDARDLFTELRKTDGDCRFNMTAERHCSATLQTNLMDIYRLAQGIMDQARAERQSLDVDVRLGSVVGLLMFALFLSGYLLLMQRRVLRPLQTLDNAIGDLGKGRTEQRIGTPPDTEFGDVFASFNEMADARAGVEALLARHRAEAEKRLEERTADLARSNADLARSNKDLEQFAYIASHDLRAPLRGIVSLVEWLREDLGDTLTGDSDRHLTLLVGRAHRLQALIDALLAYSRVGRSGDPIKPIDVGALLQSLSTTGGTSRRSRRCRS